MAQSTTTTPPQARRQHRTNTMSILALVFAFLFWPLGVVFGIVARRQIARTGESGAGLAMARLVLGIAFGVLAVIYLIAIHG